MKTACADESRTNADNPLTAHQLGLCPILVRHIFAELEENPGQESPSLDVCLVCGLTVDRNGRQAENKAEEELAEVCG